MKEQCALFKLSTCDGTIATCLTRDYQTAYMGNSSRELPYRPANMGVAPPIWGFTRKLARHSLKLHIEPTLPSTTIDKIHCN